MKIAELKKKKVLILGFGKEGTDTYLFIRKFWPNKMLGVADKQVISNFQFPIFKQFKNDKNLKKYFGKKYLEAIKDYDVIIKSPGIPFKILPKPALKKVITQTDIFFDNFPGTIIGITGTKGKGTTAGMTHQILKAGGIKAQLAGNIGKPVLSYLKNAKQNDVFVYELSSHQLYGLKKAPHIAVFLNLYKDHLDYYKSFKEYAGAKANITLHQTKNDYFIYNSEDRLVKQLAKKSKAKKIPVKGEYYDLDMAAATKVAEIFKISKDKIKKGLKAFKPLPHRLEPVGTYKNITFYDDAIATIPEATIAAINKLGGKVETIFLGGFDRNIDFNSLADAIISSNIKNIVFFPTTGKIIWQKIKNKAGKERFKTFFTDSMKDAVLFAYKNTSKGKICLLSCASSSFSIFKDYKEKGDLFKKFVKLFGRHD